MEKDTSQHCDPGRIKLFLNLSPEERLRTNDNTITAILDLQYAFKQKASDFRPEFTSEKVT